MAVKTITDTEGKPHSYEVPPWRYYSTTPNKGGAFVALENTETKKNVLHQVHGNGEFERKVFSW